MKKNYRILLHASLSLSMFFGLKSSAQIFPFLGAPSSVDPYRQWKIIETPHFEIIYDKNQKDLALKMAADAERACTFLRPYLHVETAKKTIINLADVTDDSNGSATSFPRPTIQIFPVLPAVEDSIGDYYDWLREVIQHEYTHIQNFEPSSGVMGAFNSIFGSIWKPNGFLPRWYTEGLAVEMESRLTPSGRGRSSYYSALGRAFTEDGTWGTETIDRIGATQVPTWPRGQRPYVYGYFLIHELSLLENSDKVPGDQIYGILNDRYGGHMPWFINGPVEDLFGKSYEDLLTAMYLRTNFVFDAQIHLLKSKGASN